MKTRGPRPTTLACDDQLAVNDRQLAPTTIRPPFDPRASTETPCSTSSALRTPTAVNSTLNDDATAWMVPNWAVPAGWSGSRRTATRVTRHAKSKQAINPSAELPWSRYHCASASSTVLASSGSRVSKPSLKRV